MNEKESVQNLLEKLEKLEKFTVGFDLADYSDRTNKQYLQNSMENLLEGIFKELYGNGDMAVANINKLILIRQMGKGTDGQIPPERIQQFMQQMVPHFKMILHSMQQIDDEDDQDDEQ